MKTSFNNNDLHWGAEFLDGSISPIIRHLAPTLAPH